MSFTTWDQQNFLQQLTTSEAALDGTAALYPMYHAAPLPQNGYFRGRGQTTGADATDTDKANQADKKSRAVWEDDAAHPWVNDPIGAVWDEKSQLWRTWMLTNPSYALTTDSLVSGHTTWSEFVSADLVTWVPNSFPFDLNTDGYGDLWGGSCVIDEQNTAGFGYGAVFYFISMPTDTNQTIGRWIAPELGVPPMFEGIVLSPPGQTTMPQRPGSGYRDSRVFRDDNHNQWILGVTVDYGLAFYTSTDLTNWTPSFVVDLTYWEQIECPNMFKIKSVGGSNALAYNLDANGNPTNITSYSNVEKWVVMCSMKGDHFGGVINAANQAIGYIIGDWDGTNFIPDPAYCDNTVANGGRILKYQNGNWVDQGFNLKTPRNVNQGPDFYAQAPFWRTNTETGMLETYMWGWVGNWAYAGMTPSQGFINTQSLVTTMELRYSAVESSWRLFFAPVDGQRYLYPAQKSVWSVNLYNYNDPTVATMAGWNAKSNTLFEYMQQFNPPQMANTQVLKADGSTDNLMILPSSWRFEMNLAPCFFTGGISSVLDPTHKRATKLSVKFAKSMDGTN